MQFAQRLSGFQEQVCGKDMEHVTPLRNLPTTDGVKSKASLSPALDFVLLHRAGSFELSE